MEKQIIKVKYDIIMKHPVLQDLLIHQQLLFVMPLWKKPEKQSLVLIAYDVDTGEKKAEFYCDEGEVISEIINNLVPPSKNEPIYVVSLNFSN